MRQYIVYTHLGEMMTWAVSAKKAISNIRFRIYGRGDYSWEVELWTAREVA